MSGPRPGRRMWESRISLAPHPSMAEDRIRYQVPAFEKPAHGVCIPGVRVFRWPGSVFGARYSALGADPVPGPRCRVPGTRRGNRAIRRKAWLTLRKPAHGVCIHLTGGAWTVHEIHWGMKAGLGDKTPVVPRPAR